MDCSNPIENFTQKFPGSKNLGFNMIRLNKFLGPKNMQEWYLLLYTLVVHKFFSLYSLREPL